MVGDGDGSHRDKARAKVKEVPVAVTKGDAGPRPNMIRSRSRTARSTIAWSASTGASQVLVAPAAAGTGIIAGGPMRAVFEVMGVTDIVAKASVRPTYNLVARRSTRSRTSTPAEIAAKRGKTVEISAERAKSGVPT